MSPGGRIPISSLSLPELPPSSPTVTTAVILFVICFIPFNSIESPVPPPTATILGPLFNLRRLYNASRILSPALSGFNPSIEIFVFCQPLKKIPAPNITIAKASHSDDTVIATFLINIIV